jgi:hypothetical protein
MRETVGEIRGADKAPSTDACGKADTRTSVLVRLSASPSVEDALSAFAHMQA